MLRGVEQLHRGLGHGQRLLCVGQIHGRFGHLDVLRGVEQLHRGLGHGQRLRLHGQGNGPG